MSASQDNRPRYSPPYETHRGGPEHVEQYPVIEPFGDHRDGIVLQAIGRQSPRWIPGEPFAAFLRRRAGGWYL